MGVLHTQGDRKSQQSAPCTLPTAPAPLWFATCPSSYHPHPLPDHEAVYVWMLERMRQNMIPFTFRLVLAYRPCPYYRDAWLVRQLRPSYWDAYFFDSLKSSSAHCSCERCAHWHDRNAWPVSQPPTPSVPGVGAFLCMPGRLSLDACRAPFPLFSPSFAYRSCSALQFCSSFWGRGDVGWVDKVEVGL